MFPATGSTSIAAAPSSAARRPPASLYATMRVAAVAAAVTPGLEGTPRVVRPLPASARRPSIAPW